MSSNAYLEESRARLEAFVKPILAKLGREERRRWGAFWIQGLLMEGGRKTAAGIANRHGADAQALQQFVNQSPWDWRPLRKALAELSVESLSSRCGWILDDTGFPKKGTHSVGVTRQYSGTLGKIGNCQIGVSLNYATDDCCVPLDFELYLPEEWAGDAHRRRKAGVPEEVGFRAKWQLALQMIDRALECRIPIGVVIADAGYGIIGQMRQALRERELRYVLGVQQSAGVWLKQEVYVRPEYQGRGQPRKRRYDLPKPQSVLEVAKKLTPEAWHKVTWRQGTKGDLSSRFAAVRAQPSAGHVQHQIRDIMGWLLVEWPEGEAEPVKYWISNLPEDTSLRDLVYWAKLRWWVEQNYEQLKQQIGLDHFEGRSWPGWHHHVTLCMIAFNFLVLETVRAKKNYWVDTA
ncbi:MAG: IS701 family transposase [Bacillota bacterium]|nr:IS701 family transposase [Bacillota bacterium]